MVASARQGAITSVFLGTVYLLCNLNITAIYGEGVTLTYFTFSCVGFIMYFCVRIKSKRQATDRFLILYQLNRFT